MANVLRTAVLVLFMALVALLPPSRARAQVAVMQNPTEVTVIDATTVFAQAMQMPQNEIPRSLLANAQAIAIVPGMMRGAFVVGVQYGKGVLVMRAANGAWQAPRMIQMAGGSFGYQIGVQATDLILVFRTPQSVQNLLRGTLKVGVDASAAAGPVGRQTSAATDLRLAAEILSYSRARGAFIGVSLDGSSISLDPNAEAIYYQPPGAFPASAAHLLQTIQAYAAGQPGMAPIPATGQVAPVPTTGWVASGQRTNDVESTRQQLEVASRQLFSTPGIVDNATWQQYLALPPEVYMPNQVPIPQKIQEALERYENVAKQPEYAALQVRPEFQQTLASLRRLGEVRTASNTSSTLPPPPK
jgi:lipid-binding SYLF domain-containing protein